MQRRHHKDNVLFVQMCQNRTNVSKSHECVLCYQWRPNSWVKPLDTLPLPLNVLPIVIVNFLQEAARFFQSKECRSKQPKQGENSCFLHHFLHHLFTKRQ